MNVSQILSRIIILVVVSSCGQKEDDLVKTNLQYTSESQKAPALGGRIYIGKDGQGGPFSALSGSLYFFDEKEVRVFGPGSDNGEGREYTVKGLELNVKYYRRNEEETFHFSSDYSVITKGIFEFKYTAQ